MTVSLHLAADAPLAQKVTTLQDFLAEHYFHANGMMYSMWFWRGDELRPFRPADFGGGQWVPQTKAGFSRAGYAHSENSTWNSGLFLWSQCLRFAATQAEQARAYAAKAFNSLDAIFKLTEATGRRGFFCKPYDWAASEETSPDQYIAAMLGLWAYRAIADAPSRQRIDDMLPALADWWRAHDYRLTYFGHDWSILGSYGFTCAILANHMAWQVTGNALYQDECRRIVELAGAWPNYYDNLRAHIVQTGATLWPEMLHGYEYDATRRPWLVRGWEERASDTWLTVAAADYILQHDVISANLFKYVIGRRYDLMRYGLRDGLLSLYTIQVDLERETWYPLRRPATPENIAKAEAGGWIDIPYDAEFCWGDAAGRFADLALIGHHHAPEFCPGALGLAQALLRRLDASRLHWFIDPDGQQLRPELRWMADSLSSEVPALTLIAYWRAKLYGIPLE